MNGGGARPGEGRPRRPLRRIAAADEVAEAILWPLSDRAAYVSGTVLKITGGL